jgi:chromosome segregation ATPase
MASPTLNPSKDVKDYFFYNPFINTGKDKQINEFIDEKVKRILGEKVKKFEEELNNKIKKNTEFYNNEIYKLKGNLYVVRDVLEATHRNREELFRKVEDLELEVHVFTKENAQKNQTIEFLKNKVNDLQNENKSLQEKLKISTDENQKNCEQRERLVQELEDSKHKVLILTLENTKNNKTIKTLNEKMLNLQDENKTLIKTNNNNNSPILKVISNDNKNKQELVWAAGRIALLILVATACGVTCLTMTKKSPAR